MKFMKLGSKPDQFQADGDSIRYVSTELSTDIIVNVGDVKFYLHKFPLLSKSSMLQKSIAGTSDETETEVDIHDIPGGPAAFEICAKFCYGMVVTLNAYNVVAARCAAEYLEMFETVEKGNLVYKIDVFLTSSVFRSWKDSIIVLQTTKVLVPWSEDLKITGTCLDSIATKASTDPSKVEWSYTYNRQKLLTENGNGPHWNGVKKQQTVPKDWWVEDLCELHIDLYKRVILTMNTKGRIHGDGIGESLKAYALRRIPGFGSGAIQGGDVQKLRHLVETITLLLPIEKNAVSCWFLLKLLQACIALECGEMGRQQLMQRAALRLDEASVSDFLICSREGETRAYDISVMHDLVEKFIEQEHGVERDCAGSRGDAAAKVAGLVDGYLSEAGKDSSLPLAGFLSLAEMVSSFPRSTHDGIYGAVDTYIKEHPGMSKSERKRICRLIDCKKLSDDACAHAVQNERLPLRVVVQVLFFQQARGGGGATPDLQGSFRALFPAGSYGSSRSATTYTDEDWDGDQTSKELKLIKGELTTLKLRNEGEEGEGAALVSTANEEKIGGSKVKKIFSRLWSNKERQGENSSSDTSENLASASASVEETGSSSSRNRRHISS